MQPLAKPELVSKGLKLQSLVANRHRVSIYLSSSPSCASCPVCGCHSRRVHSRYERTVADLPCHGVPVALYVDVRRFFCDDLRCERVIFAERLEGVAGAVDNASAILEGVYRSAPAIRAKSAA